MLRVVKDVLVKICEYEGEVFGCSEIECGNYRTLELSKAKNEAKSYLDNLNSREQTFEYNA